MDLTEKCLESREVYKGRVLRLRVDTVALPNGKTSLREVVEHPGGVGILALDENGCVPMVTQYRYAFSRIIMNCPRSSLAMASSTLEHSWSEYTPAAI